METELFGDGVVVVACDTTVPRTLCENEPQWLVGFEEMASAGIEFSLADHTLAEFLNQLETNQINIDGFKRSVDRCERFISKTLPILPGKKQLAGLCGPITGIQSEDPKDTVAYSQAIWRSMKNATSLEDLYRGATVERAAGGAVQIPMKHGQAALELEKERETHRANIAAQPATFSAMSENARLEHLAGDLDTDIACTPVLSVRLDAALRLEDLLIRRSQQKSGAYDPHSNNSRNDGIDYNMTWVFMKRFLLCTADDNFYKRIKLIGSYQSGWIFKPEELVNTWRTRGVNKPGWPV